MRALTIIPLVPRAISRGSEGSLTSTIVMKRVVEDRPYPT
jgi:hypothetical protein